MRDRWEIRINNIRSNGDTFRSFADARSEALRHALRVGETDLA